MINYHIQAALAAERRRDLLAEAEAARRAKQARPHRQRPGMPAARRRPIHKAGRLAVARLAVRAAIRGEGQANSAADGSEVLIRPVRGTTPRSWPTASPGCGHRARCGS